MLILKHLESTKCYVLLAVDFNINLIKINEKPKISDDFEMLINNSFLLKITLHTRLLIKHGTCIDNFFCKLTEKHYTCYIRNISKQNLWLWA